jgi:hypothetical protein
MVAVLLPKNAGGTLLAGEGKYLPIQTRLGRKGYDLELLRPDSTGNMAASTRFPEWLPRRSPWAA